MKKEQVGSHYIVKATKTVEQGVILYTVETVMRHVGNLPDGGQKITDKRLNITRSRDKASFVRSVESSQRKQRTLKVVYVGFEDDD